MGYFEGAATSYQDKSGEELQKALEAGNGVNSAAYINGRALIPENCESTMVNVVAELKEDCKLFNSMKTVPVASTVHEENRRSSHGDYRFLSTTEGGKSRATDQAIERVFYEQKYLQTLRGVTLQMEKVRTFEDAYTSEKIAGVQTICKGAEYNMFHGNASVIPTDWDGFPEAIRKSESPNIKDLRGKTLGSEGEKLFDNIAREVMERGGDLSKVFFPPLMAQPVKELFTDRLRMMVKDKQATFDQLPDYPTAIGSTLRFAGPNVGADKFYRVKGLVKAAGDKKERPMAPASVTAVARANEPGSLFLAADGGDYTYTVHAENSAGISAGTPIAIPVTVAANGGVLLTITPNEDGELATGFVLCRSNPNKPDLGVMEMKHIPAVKGDAPTTYIDINKDLPGTASMLFLTETRESNVVYRLGQLLPVSTFPLYPVDRAITPFLVIIFCTLEVSAPEFCALVDNIAYPGGLY